MFQNVLMSGLTTPLCNTDEVRCWDNRPFATVWPETQSTSRSEGTEITRTIRKKTKRARTAFTTDQLRALEKTFVHCKYITPQNRRLLAAQLNMEDKCIKIWFQNRRMKEKRESESSCDSFTDSSSVATPPPPPPPPPPTLKVEQNLDQSYKVEYSNFVLPSQFDTLNAEPQYQLSSIQYENHTHLYDAPINIPQSTYSWYNNNEYPTEYYPYPQFNTTQYPEQNNWFNQNEFNYF